jgi:arylsulfatase A-like enzyme
LGGAGSSGSTGSSPLCYDNHQIEPPRSPEQGYHLTEDLTDKAMQFIADVKQVAPHKPFFLYFCTGATHAPISAETVGGPVAGQFDDGWDAYQERVLARQKELGVMPANRNCHAMIRTSRTGTRCRRLLAGWRLG